MKQFFPLALFLAIATTAAESATRTISIAVGGIRPTYNSSLADGVSLPGTGTPGADVDIMLPPNYKKNTAITVKLLMYTQDTNCTVHFLPEGTTRYRPGLTKYGISGSASGLTTASPVVFTPPSTAQNVFVREYKLKANTEAPYTSQKPGDVIVMSFRRFADSNATDTCPNPLYIVGAKLKYTLK